MSGIYIHIPFCHKACHYCDFHFSTNLKSIDRMVTSIITELKHRASAHVGEINTIYFGGGTPSVLSPTHLSDILETIDENFPVNDIAEITLEANPEDLTAEKSDLLHSLGINRVSIGVQTFNTNLLKMINRNHDEKSAFQAIENVRKSGFKNLTIDLIFGLPTEDSGYFRKDLETAIDLDIPHLSVYGLTIEEGTVFGNWTKKGILKVPGESIHLEHYLLAEEMLEKAGFIHYEVSNYAKEGAFSKHNSSYWLGSHYLGVGPGAHSYDGSSRRINISSNPAYMKAIENDSSYYETEVLDSVDRVNEYILTRIRTIYGVDSIALREKLGTDILKDKASHLNKLEIQGYVKIDDGLIRLTRKGMVIADEISLQLFYDK